MDRDDSIEACRLRAKDFNHRRMINMKWKKVLILGLCLAMLGCGQAQNSGEVNGSMKEPVATQEIFGGASESKGGEITGNGEVKSEEGKTGEENNGGSTGTGTLKKLGAGSGELEPVTLENAYQRAAYLADQVYAKNKKSTLVSPLSLEIALGLVAEGASGETAKELYHYLGNEKYADWVQNYMAFWKERDRSDTGKASDDEFDYSSKYSFHYEIANSIWVREGNKLLPEYQKIVSGKFGAQAENVDFMGKSEETAEKINAWCKEKTHGMIPKMVEPEMFSPALAAILMNSVYFESPWVEKWGQTEHTFKNMQGDVTTQEMLIDTLSAYYENEKATAFSKDYYNGLQFIGILPKQEGDFRISDLDLNSLLASQTYEYDVRAIAPKLNFDTTADNIIDILRAQGVSKAFEFGGAEFDKMIQDSDSLYISDILQKCKIEMDEEGTRAAAVTMIAMCEGCALVEPKIMKEVFLDRPFAFLIYDSVKDQIVFVGKVTEL